MTIESVVMISRYMQLIIILIISAKLIIALSRLSLSLTNCLQLHICTRSIDWFDLIYSSSSSETLSFAYSAKITSHSCLTCLAHSVTCGSLIVDSTVVMVWLHMCGCLCLVGERWSSLAWHSECYWWWCLTDSISSYIYTHIKLIHKT